MTTWRQRSERDLPAVFTPPRDELGVLPHFNGAAAQPNEVSWEHSVDRAHITKQAWVLLLKVGCTFGLGLALLAVLYEITLMVFGRQTYTDCAEQDFGSGTIRAADHGQKAVVHCWRGFAVNVSYASQLRCLKYKEMCDAPRSATYDEDEAEGCLALYAFTTDPLSREALRLEKALDDAGGQPTMAETGWNASSIWPVGGLTELEKEFLDDQHTKLDNAMLAANSAASGACVPRKVGQASRLYGVRETPLGLPMPAATTLQHWSGSASLVATGSLALIALIALVFAGVTQGRRVSRGQAVQASLIEDDLTDTL